MRFRSLALAGATSGSLLLAATGLLNGRRATTHWSRSEQFAVRLQAHCVARGAIDRDDRNGLMLRAARDVDMVAHGKNSLALSGP
jgi:putative intracellular protease/amidase